MNRIVLIGNGFDLAHGLKTSYADFIDWYWKYWGRRLLNGLNRIEDDGLCSFKIKDNIEVQNWASVFQGWYYKRDNPLMPWEVNDVVALAKQDKKLCDFKMSPFFERIQNSIETKGWVDIENEYYNLLKKYALTESLSEKIYELNSQLQHIQELLTNYLAMACQKEIKPADNLWNKIYAPINPQDISIEGMAGFREYVNNCINIQSLDWKNKQSRYGLSDESITVIENYKQKYGKIYQIGYPDLFLLPDWILFVNFNYTNTANVYMRNNVSSQIHIHGEMYDPQNIIFGYGDEMDQNFSKLQNLNDNECLRKIKSIKYLESDNYRNVLGFVDSAPYQIYIMGHSCGNSDRTLLNTLFEHKNCISIKPYYYIKDDGSDNYLELVQNISRNFTDMKLMRDRVVNKTYCEPLLK